MRCPSTCVSCTLILLLASLHLSSSTPAKEGKVAPAASTKPGTSTAKLEKAPSSSADGTSASQGVDAGDPTKRVSRGSDESDDEEITQSGIPELIPIAESRKVRGNGADLVPAADSENGSPSSAVELVNSIMADFEREAREEGFLDPEVELDSNLNARSQKCANDGDKCLENVGCCSLFCSWTRNFTCYTVAG
ncbi:uncharacterized protein LOC110842439 [Folsomia candida]|nr:uncharacterized protein LOC110842439 [Folsomia candida]